MKNRYYSDRDRLFATVPVGKATLDSGYIKRRCVDITNGADRFCDTQILTETLSKLGVIKDDLARRAFNAREHLRAFEAEGRAELGNPDYVCTIGREETKMGIDRMYRDWRILAEDIQPTEAVQFKKCVR